MTSVTKKSAARNRKSPSAKKAAVMEEPAVEKETISLVVPRLVDIHKKNLQQKGYDCFLEWKVKPGHLYIGRNMAFYVPGTEASIWRNKYSVKKYGLEECLRLYEMDIRNSDLYDRLDELSGLKLGCWCHDDFSPEKKCHGDVLIALFKEKHDL